MSICELPKATSRLLSSTQVLTAPASLVKELLDNALDAKATSVDILIAANTIDRIEVHDNGHGICPQDLNVIGKRGYTSKIRDFDELKTLGGRSLGFRGEALSSALELGNVSITTRVDGEAVATAVQLKDHGGFESQTSTSHPVGTTICVTKMFSSLPVRKQTALKGASKTMSTIKAMLHSYALARVNVRLTFRVLKSGQSFWSFAPRATDGMRELVSQMIGREIAAQCVEVISVIPSLAQVETGTSSLGGTLMNQSTHLCSEVPRPELTIQAFLPKADADFTKVKGSQYVSIDSRPVSPMRGTPKKIISIYRKKLAAVLGGHFIEQLKSPFIRLNIICPAGSYDPNVEPAKDDILFENEELILSIFEAWLSNIYGDLDEAMCPSRRPSTNSDYISESACLVTNVELPRISRVAPFHITSETGISKDLDRCASQISISGLEARETQDAIQPPHRLRPSFDMSENYLDDEECDTDNQLRDCNRNTAEGTKHKQECQNLDSLNPWVIAKLVAPATKIKPTESHLTDFVKSSYQNRSPSIPIMLRTPCGFSPLRSSLDAGNVESLDTPSLQNIAAVENSQVSIEGWLKGHREMSQDNITQLRHVPFPSPESANEERNGTETVPVGIIHHESSSQIFQSPSATRERLRHRTLRNATEPFVPPLQVNRLGRPPATETRTKSTISYQPQIADADTVSEGDIRHHGGEYMQASDVYDALDFERRKGAATRKLREELRLSRSHAEVAANVEPRHGGSFPLKDRTSTTAAVLDSNPVSSLNETLDNEIPTQTSLADDDPRAYLLRRQRSNAASFGEPRTGRGLKRMKTALLPLETIPDNVKVHNLMQAVRTNSNLVHKALLNLESFDQYVKSGTQEKGLFIPSADIQVVRMQLESLVKDLWKGTTDAKVAVVLDLRRLDGRCVIGA